MRSVETNPPKKNTGLTLEPISALLDSVVDGIVIIDTEGEILYFNRAAQILFGYQPDEVLQNSVTMLMPAPSGKKHDSYIQNYLVTGERKIIGIGRKVDARNKDGKEFPILLSVGEYLDNDTRYFIGTIRDLTKQLETEQIVQEFRDRLTQVDRISALGEMASGIAHELNQPLAAIASYAQAARRRIESAQADPTRMINLLTKVEAQALRAGKVIDRMRSLSKSDATPRDRFGINDVVEEAIELIKPEAANRGVVVQTHYMLSNCEIVVDAVQIQQVVLNLIRNAIDATEEAGVEKGVVFVKTLVDQDDNAVVLIQDNGPGISDEIRARMFQPFVTSKSYGTGLGLSISRSIVDAHGGKLEAKNVASGAVFSFTIPVAVAPDD